MILLLSFSVSSLRAQYDTLTVMYYNTLNFPDGGDPGREVYFRTVNQYVNADIILINELTSEAGANLLLNSALNVFGTTQYQRANFTDGPTTDNMLFYNSEKLGLHSQWYIITPLRYINEYVLYYKPGYPLPDGDTVFLYFYVAHLKANPEDSLQRLAEVNAFRQRLDNLPNAENIFFGGDLNLYTSAEPAYQALINDGFYKLNDPLPAGNWHENYSFRHYHTQSTRTTDFGGGVSGGLDDRFDFILFSDEVLTGDKGVRYIENSCVAFGNDGNHFNGSLVDLPLNPNIPDSVTWALYYMSDHLPVICNIRIDSPIVLPDPKVVITEIMYNPPGPDQLEYIELYNNANIPVNLQGYYFSDGIGFTFPDIELQPGEFTVVSRFSQEMLNFFGIETLQWSTGVLSNIESLIRLKDVSGKTVDSVFYKGVPPWPTSPNGSGPSLVLCNPNVDNALGENWSASSYFAGVDMNNFAVYGTPGFSECLFPPLAYFKADTNQIAAGSSVQFTDLSANSPTSWTWNFQGGIPATSHLQNPSVFYPQSGVFDVELIVTNQAGGNSFIKSGYITVTDSYEGLLMITEIMQNPFAVADPQGEWFEVFNPSANPIDMLKWKIRDNGTTHTISTSLVVPSKGFAVLGYNANPATNGGYVCDYQYTGILLGNSADYIVLYDSNQNVIDSVRYDGGIIWPAPNGVSMVFTGSPADDNNIAANWVLATVREPSFTGTSGDKGSPGTNGMFQNLVSNDFFLQLKVYLEGPFNGNTMIPFPGGFVPLNQPYTSLPWNYGGSETAASIPGNVIDWVLIELRDAPSAAGATGSTTIARRAAFLLGDGSVVDPDGSADLPFSFSVSQQLFVVVHHRNHLSVLSDSPLLKTGNIYSYDFTNGISKAYMQGQKEIAPGIWGMIAGDADASGIINATDKSDLWESNAGRRGYLPADFNFDAEVNNKDKNDFWLPNLGAGSQVPAL